MRTLKKMTIVLAASACIGATGCTNKPQNQPTPNTNTMGVLPRDTQVHAYVNSMREDLSRGKVKMITATMNLSTDESRVFWPLYQQYESELFTLSDRRVDVIDRLSKTSPDARITPDDATKLAGEYFSFEAARNDLLKKYHAEIARVLSPVRAAQFVQIEHRVNTLIDLLIASEIPILEGKGSN
jgi:hypothetical protein